MISMERWFTCFVFLLKIVMGTSNMYYRSSSRTSANLTFAVVTDGNAATCGTFEGGSDLPLMTDLSISMDPLDNSEHTIIVEGQGMGCLPTDNSKLYLLLVPDNQRMSRLARTETCVLSQATPGEPDVCIYQCDCSGVCDAIRLIHRPLTSSMSPWSLCSIYSTSSGELSLISRISSCTASSTFGAAYACQYSYDGTEGAAGGLLEWAMKNGRGVGEWMQVNMDDTYILTSLEILHRCHSGAQVSSWDIEFEKDKHVKVSRSCGGTDQYTDCSGPGNTWFPVQLPHVIYTASIKFRITAVCGTAATGIREIKLLGYE